MLSATKRILRSSDDGPANGASAHYDPGQTGTIINAGAVIAVLLGIPSALIGVFGAVGVITGEKLVAGAAGALWGYLAAAGAYELNRRKFSWVRGRKYRDCHLFGGTLAVSTGIIIGGALHETMPALAIVCALSAIKQANHGHRKKYLAWIHVATLAFGIYGAIWFYRAGNFGKILLERMASLP